MITLATVKRFDTGFFIILDKKNIADLPNLLSQNLLNAELGDIL